MNCEIREIFGPQKFLVAELGKKFIAELNCEIREIFGRRQIVDEDAICEYWGF